MKKYIDKAAVVAEIEKKKIPFKKDIEDGVYPTYLCALMDFEDFINSLEMKEVDLDKEFDNYTKDILACDVQFEPFTHLYNCAKHFYELGLKTKGG